MKENEPCSAKETQISRELSFLSNNLVKLHSSIESLQQRLASILRHGEILPDECKKEKKEERELVELANILLEKNASIETAIYHLQSIHNQIEL